MAQRSGIVFCTGVHSPSGDFEPPSGEFGGSFFLYGQYCQRWRSGALFALLHKAGFRGTRKRLAILAHRFGCAGVDHAFLYERGLGRACKRLAVLADRLALASLLCEGGSTRKCYDECSEHYFPEHGSLPSMVIAIEFDPSRLFQARLKIQFRKARRLVRITNCGSIPSAPRIHRAMDMLRADNMLMQPRAARALSTHQRTHPDGTVPGCRLLGQRIQNSFNLRAGCGNAQDLVLAWCRRLACVLAASGEALAG